MSITQTSPLARIDNQKLHAALASSARPRRASALTASLLFGWRALLKIKHVPMQLFDVTAFPAMLTLIFTYMFGGALAGSTGEYLHLFLPGILVQTVTMITMYTGFTLNTDISKGIFDRFRSMPIWGPATIVGALLGDAVRYSIAALMVIILGLIMGFRPDGGVPGVLLAVLLILTFSFSLSWIWTALGLILPTPNSVMGISSMIMFIFTFGSNIFVDPKTMPVWLQVAVNLNPISHLVTATRGLMHGTSTVDQIARVLLVCAVLIILFAPLTMYFYRNKKVR